MAEGQWTFEQSLDSLHDKGLGLGRKGGLLIEFKQPGLFRAPATGAEGNSRSIAEGLHGGDGAVGFAQESPVAIASKELELVPLGARTDDHQPGPGIPPELLLSESNAALIGSPQDDLQGGCDGLSWIQQQAQKIAAAQPLVGQRRLQLARLGHAGSLHGPAEFRAERCRSRGDGAGFQPAELGRPLQQNLLLQCG